MVDRDSRTAGAELPWNIHTWLEELRLAHYSELAGAWCRETGVLDLDTLLGCRENFSESLGLKPLERKRVASYTRHKDKITCAKKATLGKLSGAPASIGPADRQYRILEQLGCGATATVYKCTRGEQAFAVKCVNIARLRLRRDFAGCADMLQREVQILLSLEHPKIVRLFDIFEDADELHLVMELVEGGTLFDKVAEGALSERVAQHVFRQIVQGLQFIHSKGIVYRDLKLENVLVEAKCSSEGFLMVKLSDFGHSKLVDDGYTMARSRVGTPEYWAPEVSDPARAAQGYDKAVDLWCLGVMVYVMLVRAYPFEGDRRMNEKKLTFQRSPVWQTLSAAAKHLIESLIKFDPQERLSLENCLLHPWVSRSQEVDAIQCEELSEKEILIEQADEKQIFLPTHPSKILLRELRNDLHAWMRRFKCFAAVRNGAVVAQLTRLPEEEIEVVRQALRSLVLNRLGAVVFLHRLLVTPGVGAGLALCPEEGGMRVESVCDAPGQPGLQHKDLIMEIDGTSLSAGSPTRVEEIFGAHFRDGVPLLVKRSR